MTGLNQDERKSIAEKLMEFGNLAGAGRKLGPVCAASRDTVQFQARPWLTH